MILIGLFLMTGSAFGQQTIHSRKVDAFRSIDLAGKLTVELIRSDTTGVDIKLNNTSIEKLQWGVKDGVLSISSSTTWKERLEKAREARTMIASEIKLPEFSRSFILPDDSDTAAISAENTNGILSVRIPRLKKAEPGRIEIKIGR